MHTFLFYLNIACALLNIWVAMAVSHTGTGSPWVNMGLGAICLFGAYRANKQSVKCLTEPCIVCQKKAK